MPVDSEIVRVAFSGTLKTDLSSDCRGSRHMVAGYHLDQDTGFLAGS